MDYEKIENQVAQVISYSQNFNPNVEQLMSDWYAGKHRFINMFGGKLIYELGQEITVDLSESDKNYKINDFCNMIENDFSCYEDLIHFIKANKNYLFSNILEEDYVEDGYEIKAGIKISKAIRKFIDNETDLYLIQTAISRIIQENKITGRLCLSVHPLDYLSSSENTYNWRSCHALDGSYRAGNLSYMTDSSTIVCYLKGADDVELPRFPSNVRWNNKKWRMLLHVSTNNNALFAGRHYPFFCQYLMEEIRSNFIKLLPRNLYPSWMEPCYQMEWSKWHNDSFKRITFSEHHSDDFYLNDIYIPIRNKIVKLKDIVKDNLNPLHFNDILKSSCYEPYYCWKKDNSQKILFNIGKDVRCLECGGWVLQEPESMRCQYCERDRNMFECVECGELLDEDEVIWNGNGDPICDNCADNYYRLCAVCGELYRTRYMTCIDDEWYCPNCMEGEDNGER